jgi:hypothetical protein
MILGGNRPLSGPDHLTQAVFRDVPLSRAPKPLKPLVVDADVGFNGNHKMAHDQNIHIRKHLKTLFTSQI